MMKSNRSSIQKTFQNYMLLTASVTFFLTFGLWIYNEYRDFLFENKQLKENLIEYQKRELKSQVSHVVDYINYMITHSAGENPHQLQKEIIERIVGIRFQPEGYFFGSTYDGSPLFSNGVITEGTGSIYNLTDPNGVKIIQEQIKAASNPDGGFVFYQWHKLNESEPLPKISYVMGINELGWVIGAGAYMNTIEKETDKKKTLLRKSLVAKFFKSCFLLLGIICMILLWLRHISVKLQTNIDKFSSFFIKAAKESVTINPDELHFSEFKKIAESVNQMLKDRLNAENALIKSKKALLQAEKLAKIGNWEWTSETDTVVWSDQMYELMEIEPGSPVPDREKQKQFYHPEDWDKVYRLMDQAYKNKLPTTFETRLIDNNGEIKNIFANVRASLDKNGNVTGLFGTYQDITYRKKTEKALIESEERYRTLFENTPEGIISTLPGGTIISANPTCAEMYGVRKAEEMIGKSAYDIYFKPSERDEIISKLREKGYLKDFEMTMKKNNGELRRIMATLKVVHDNEGKHIRTDCIFKDITEKTRLEEQLRQVYKMEAIGTLAGGIAHDFNNILGIIIGNAELAKDEIPAWSPGRDNINEILIASFRARDVIRQLLSFSRNTKQTKRVVDISPIIKESVSLLRASIPTTIDINSSIPKGLKAIDADPTQIHQVLINLCTNSAHAMEETGGKIDILLEEIKLDEKDLADFHDLKPGSYIQLIIQDTGHGISPDIIDRIFEPYFTTKEMDKGTGMGLAVVHGIIKNHQGDISVKSHPGKGTEVKILLPASEELPPKNETAAEEKPKGTETILFVDDETSIVQMSTQILEGLGYKVFSKTNPTDALNTFRESPEAFDLLITDMTMPQMTGEELAMTILSTRPDLPVILCTGFSEKINETRAGELGIRKYIEKPVSQIDLAKAIREVLDSQG